MHKRIKLWRILLCATGVANVDNQVYAQDDALADNLLEEVIVTAQRRAEPLQRTPVAVSAFNPDSLSERSVNTVSDLAAYVPNVEIGSGRPDAGASAPSVFIRGVGQSDFLFPNDPGVGIYVDGAYLARSVGSNLDLSDVAQVEVLRGPQGTLYGKNTIGGAITVTTLKPSLTDSHGRVVMTGGQFNRRDIDGYLTTPLVNDILGFKISATSRRRDGWQSRQVDNLRYGDMNRFGVRSALLWQPVSAFSALLSADYSRQRENGAANFLANRVPSEVRVPAPVPDVTPSTPLDLVDLFNFVAAPAVNAQAGLPADSVFDGRWISDRRDVTYASGAARDNNNVRGISLTLNGDLSDHVMLKSITAWRDMDAKFARDGDGSPYDILQTDNTQTQRQLSQEMQLSVTALDNRLNWISGAYFMSEQATDDNVVYLLRPLTLFTGGMVNLDWNTYSRIRTQTWAVFSQATFAFNNQWSVVAGGRYSRDRKKLYQNHRLADFPQTDAYGNLTYCYTCLADGVTGRTLEKTWSAFTPKLGVNYQLSGDVLLYASYARGFKSGGWSPRPTPTNPSSLPFDPEYLVSYEMGAKTQWFDHRVTLNVAGFINNYKDVQLTVLNGNFLLEVTNAAQSRIEGLEAELKARLLPHLDWDVSAGYLRNHYTSLDTSDPHLSRDDVLPNAPKWVLSTGLQYAYAIGKAGQLTARVDTSYRSRSFTEPYNIDRGSVLQFENGVPTGDVAVPNGVDGYRVTRRQIAQDGYWLTNARISFTDASEKWTAALFVTNLTDTHYATALLPISAFGLDTGTWGRPREWGASLGFSF